MTEQTTQGLATVATEPQDISVEEFLGATPKNTDENISTAAGSTGAAGEGATPADNEEITEEEIDKQVKAFEAGGDLPENKKALRRVFETNIKAHRELKQDLASKQAELDQKVKLFEHNSKVQRLQNLAEAYKKDYVDSQERKPEDFATAEEYRRYTSNYDMYKTAFETELKKLAAEIKTEQAEFAQAASKPAEDYKFKTPEEFNKFNELVKAYSSNVPEFAQIAPRWRELPHSSLDIITKSPIAPALLHAAIAEGYSELPEHEQARAIYILEAGILEQLKASGSAAAAPATANQKPPESGKPPVKAPPNFKTSGAAPDKDTITVKDILSGKVF